MRQREHGYAEYIKSSVPIAGKQYVYEDTQPDIENCSSGIAPQPNTTADGREKMTVPVVVSMTKFLFDHYRLNMYSYIDHLMPLFQRLFAAARPNAFLFERTSGTIRAFINGRNDLQTGR